MVEDNEAEGDEEKEETTAIKEEAPAQENGEPQDKEDTSTGRQSDNFFIEVAKGEGWWALIRNRPILALIEYTSWIPSNITTKFATSMKQANKHLCDLLIWVGVH